MKTRYALPYLGLGVTAIMAAGCPYDGYYVRMYCYGADGVLITNTSLATACCEAGQEEGREGESKMLIGRPKMGDDGVPPGDCPQEFGRPIGDVLQQASKESEATKGNLAGAGLLGGYGSKTAQDAFAPNPNPGGGPSDDGDPGADPEDGDDGTPDNPDDGKGGATADFTDPGGAQDPSKKNPGTRASGGGGGGGLAGGGGGGGLSLNPTGTQSAATAAFGNGANGAGTGNGAQSGVTFAGGGAGGGGRRGGGSGSGNQAMSGGEDQGATAGVGGSVEGEGVNGSAMDIFDIIDQRYKKTTKGW